MAGWPKIRLARRVLAVLAGLVRAVDLVLFNHAITDLGAGIATTRAT